MTDETRRSVLRKAGGIVAGIGLSTGVASADGGWSQYMDGDRDRDDTNSDVDYSKCEAGSWSHCDSDNPYSNRGTKDVSALCSKEQSTEFKFAESGCAFWAALAAYDMVPGDAGLVLIGCTGGAFTCATYRLLNEKLNRQENPVQKATFYEMDEPIRDLNKGDIVVQPVNSA